MEPEHSVSSVYRSVIDDVVSHIKPDFVGEGVDEAVLDELRVLWETKLTQSGALDPVPASAPTGVAYGTAAPQLGYPYAGAGMAYMGGSSAAAAHQHSGALKRKLEETGSWPTGVVPAKHAAHAGVIPQQDGPADEPSVVRAAGGAGSSAGKAGGGGSEDAEEGDDPAEKLDTLSDVESDEAEEDKEYENVVVAQFDKVTRTKNKWKCTLKDGVMQLNGRDILFNSASGEMQF
ncbi:hypothetical protein WJX81_002798 [Elliptochloris bilobata]|uniref:Uncharacterized protein n=1 Tax=Elliptochloris bilobata TaxID=381761 RepID=A0AAW1REB3_9CHLO